MIGGPRPGDDGSEQPVLAAWRAAEEQLSALVLTTPEAYERSLGAVRRAADELRRCTTVDELVAAWRERAAVLPVDADPLLASPIVVGAAFLLRHRELVAAHRAAALGERIEAASATGQRWVTLTDAPWPTGPALRPYERVDLRLTDRTALRAVVELDADTYVPVFAVEVVGPDGTTTRQTYPDQDSWRAGFEETRRSLDPPSDP